MIIIIIPLFTLGNVFNIKASLLENRSKSKHIFEQLSEGKLIKSSPGFKLVELGTNVKQIQLVIWGTWSRGLLIIS